MPPIVQTEMIIYYNIRAIDQTQINVSQNRSAQVQNRSNLYFPITIFAQNTNYLLLHTNTIAIK